MKLDMNALMKQAQQMQEQMAQAQEAAKEEVAEASAGGGMVTARANGAGELVEIRIDPRAIDPDDPEMLADMVLAASTTYRIRIRSENGMASASGTVATPSSSQRR